MADFAELDAMIASVRMLGGERMPFEVAKAAAPRIDAAIKASARAGKAPDGTAWPPRKKDGAPALAGVEKHITTEAVGLVVVTTLTGHAVFSNFGAGIPRRQVIPDSAQSIPPAVYAAALEGAKETFERVCSGAIR